MQIISPRSGTGLELKKGQQLKIIDIEGQQVSDFFCFFKSDPEDYLSSGRTIDYLSRTLLKNGDKLYSSKSKVMAKIVEDKVEKHDFLLTPCCAETFKMQNQEPHRGCQGNLLEAFENLGLHHKALPTTFNIFMNVDVLENGTLKIHAPRSKPGDYIIIEAVEDLLVGITACSAPNSNNGSFKPIGFEVINAH